MLRILAKTVADVWANKPADAGLIHTHHIDLGNEGIRREFTTRINQSQFDSAILNDIHGRDGRAALASSIDAERFSGLLPYASYVARTIFVHTMAFNNELRGISPARLRYSVLSPEADLSFVASAESAFIQGSASQREQPFPFLCKNAEIPSQIGPGEGEQDHQRQGPTPERQGHGRHDIARGPSDQRIACPEQRGEGQQQVRA